MDIAVAGVATVLSLNGVDGVCAEARIALGAVAPTPIRATKAEKTLAGRKIDEEVVELAASTASTEASPITDIRASEAYRRAMVRVLAGRAIKRAYDKCVAG